MGIFQRVFGREQKQSAAASVMVQYQVGQPQWMQRDYPKFVEEAYIRNVIGHRCIKMIAEGCASIPFTMTGSGKDLKTHKLLDLLARPNPLQSHDEFIEAVISYKLIAGNSFVEAVTAGERGNVINPDNMPPIELFSLRPDYMQIIPAANGYPSAYRYTNGASTVNYLLDTITGKSNILHLRTFNPKSHWWGLSAIEAAAYSIDQHNQAGAWNQALLQNGARPSGALIVKGADGNGGNLSDEQYSRLKVQMDEQYSGAKNAGKPLLLEGGLEWKEMSLSPKDMDFLECKNSSARDIALAFGVPPMLLGIPGDNTYSNMQEARLALWEQTIIPLFRNLVGELNHWLVPRFGQGLELGYDEDEILALAPRREKIWEQAQQADFITINEKREKTGYGAAPADGGDVVLVQSTMVPLAEAGVMQRSNIGTNVSAKLDYISMLVKANVPEKEAAELADRFYD